LRKAGWGTSFANSSFQSDSLRFFDLAASTVRTIEKRVSAKPKNTLHDTDVVKAAMPLGPE